MLANEAGWSNNHNPHEVFNKLGIIMPQNVDSGLDDTFQFPSVQHPAHPNHPANRGGRGYAAAYAHDNDESRGTIL